MGSVSQEQRKRPDNRAGWSLLLSVMKFRRAGLALGVVVGLSWTLCKMTTGLIVREAVDEGIEADDMAVLRYWTIVLAVVAIGTGVFTGLRRYVAFREARWVETHLRDRLFAHAQRLHFAFHDRMPTGELLSRANTDLQQVFALVVLVPITMSNALTVLGVTAILITIDPLLTLLALGSLPFLNLFATRFNRQLHPYMQGIQRESAELAAVVEETVAGVRVIKGLGAERVQAARLRKEADDVFTEAIGAARVRSRYIPALEVLPSIGLIAVLGYGGNQVLDGNLTLGSLIAFNVYVAMLIWPLRMLGMTVAQAQRAAVSAKRAHEILDVAPEVADPQSPVALPEAGGGALSLEGVTFSYSTGDPVLKGMDLHVRAGESVALVGATGSGKTSVARLVPRFYDVQEGRVLLDGVDVRDVGLTELRRAVGLVFEDTFLFSDSIAANIAFARPDASQDDIERAAKLAGAHEFISHIDEGYETQIGERGYSLSGGQRQRVAIARAILADPRVLILDDATSAVDPTKEHEIRAALEEVMKGRTTLVIAHRPATIALADRVVLLDGGRVVAEGTHDSLLATSSRYREVLAAQDQELGDGDEAGDSSSDGSSAGALDGAAGGVAEGDVEARAGVSGQ